MKARLKGIRLQESLASAILLKESLANATLFKQYYESPAIAILEGIFFCYVSLANACLVKASF